MVSLCEFARDVDERARDQFIAYVSDSKIRERLLQEPNDRTLAQIITLASTLEKSSASSYAIARSIGARCRQRQAKLAFWLSRPLHLLTLIAFM